VNPGAEGWEEKPAGPREAKAGTGGKAGHEPPPAPRFSSVEDFVADYLSLVSEVRLGGPLVWCANWWAHPEAVLRLTALWRAWEALRLVPAMGMSNWWTLHYDPHMKVLLDAERGPFAPCTRGQHQDGKPGPLPLVGPPEGWGTAPLR
jgi:Domain of unknown function (DUF4913)